MMFNLRVGVPVSAATNPLITSAHLLKIAQDNRQGLDVTAFFNLLDRISQKLEQMGKLQVSQHIEILRRAEAGGYIWWYTLKYGGTTIASNNRNDSVDAYSLSVGLVEPDPETSSDVLSTKVLRQFVRDLRVDLKDLGKLESYQVVDMFTRLKVLEIVDDFEVEEQQASKDNFFGNNNSGPTQCVPPPPHFLSTSNLTLFQQIDPDSGQWITHSSCIEPRDSPSLPLRDPTGFSFTPSATTPSENVDADFWLESRTSLPSALSASYITSPPTGSPIAPPRLMECSQQTGTETSIGPSFGADVRRARYIELLDSSRQVPNAIGPTYGSPGATQLAELATALPSGMGITSYPTTYIDSSPAGRQLEVPAFLVHHAADTPGSIRVPHVVPAATPTASVPPSGLQARALSSSAPPTNHANPSRTVELPTLFDAGVPTAQQANAPKQNRDPLKQQRTIFELLQSCKFGDSGVSLSKDQIQKVLKMGSRLVARDFSRILQPLLEHGTDTPSSTPKRLGLSETWKGIEGAVNYLTVLDKDKGKKVVLKPLARRVAQVLLYLNYENLCKQGETNVIDRVLAKYHEDPNKSMPKKFRHNNFSTYHVRRGRWWWRLAASLGFGILCVADDALMRAMCSDRFTNDQIDIFITFVLRTRPGTVRLFRSLQSITESLIDGCIPGDLRQILYDEDTGLLSYKALVSARKEDLKAFWSQNSEDLWTVEYTKNSVAIG